LYLAFMAAVVSVAAAVRSSSGSGVAAESCVSPSLTTSLQSVRVRESTKVSGQWFWQDCNDVVTHGTQPPPNTPIATVRLVLRTHDGHTFDLGLTHADLAGSFTITITVPDGVPPGPAQIKDKAGLGSPAKIVVHP